LDVLDAGNGIVGQSCTCIYALTDSTLIHLVNSRAGGYCLKLK